MSLAWVYNITFSRSHIYNHPLSWIFGDFGFLNQEEIWRFQWCSWTKHGIFMRNILIGYSKGIQQYLEPYTHWGYDSEYSEIWERGSQVTIFQYEVMVQFWMIGITHISGSHYLIDVIDGEVIAFRQNTHSYGRHSHSL